MWNETFKWSHREKLQEVKASHVESRISRSTLIILVTEILCNSIVIHRALLILYDGRPITHKIWCAYWRIMAGQNNSKMAVVFSHQYASLRGSEARQGRNYVGIGTPLVEIQVEEISTQHHNSKNQGKIRAELGLARSTSAIGGHCFVASSVNNKTTTSSPKRDSLWLVNQTNIRPLHIVEAEGYNTPLYKYCCFVQIQAFKLSGYTICPMQNHA